MFSLVNLKEIEGYCGSISQGVRTMIEFCSAHNSRALLDDRNFYYYESNRLLTVFIKVCGGVALQDYDIVFVGALGSNPPPHPSESFPCIAEYCTKRTLFLRTHNFYYLLKQLLVKNV